MLSLRAAFAKAEMAAVTGIRRRQRSPAVLTPELEQRILDTTRKTRPGDGSTHWSVRMLAAHLRVSRTMGHRVWQRHDAQPHPVERFKLFNEPQFEEKVRDIVGLYLDPPDRALVLCVDHWPKDPARHVPQRRRTGAGDLRVARAVEWLTGSLHLESLGGRHLGQSAPR